MIVKYFESETATASDAQDYPAYNLKTVTHNSNGKGKVTYTSNSSFEQKFSRNQTLPVVAQNINLRIDHRIVPNLASPQTLLTPDMKEVVADAAYICALVKRTPRKVGMTGVNGSTPGDVFNAVSVEHTPSPVIIGIVATSSSCSLSGSLQFAKKHQSMSLGLGCNTQKLDADVDGNIPNDMDSVSIFRKVIGYKLPGVSRRDLYLLCKMKFANALIKTQAPHFMDMGFLFINILNESGVLGTTVTRIQGPTFTYHWSEAYYVFGEATEDGISAAKSEHTFNYKLVLKFRGKIRNLRTKLF